MKKVTQVNKKASETPPSKKYASEVFLNRIDALLDELVIEAVRNGIPKSQVEYIYDVRRKTIPAIRTAMEKRKL